MTNFDFSRFELDLDDRNSILEQRKKLEATLKHESPPWMSPLSSTRHLSPTMMSDPDPLNGLTNVS